MPRADARKAHIAQGYGRHSSHESSHGIPGRTRPGVINHRDGGRGLYFEDPDGHLLEIITRPYGSSS